MSGARLVAEPGVDGAHRQVVRVVAGLEDVEAVVDRPGDGRPLERAGQAASAPVAGDGGHVVPGDPARVGRLQQQAGVADDAAGGSSRRRS